MIYLFLALIAHADQFLGYAFGMILPAIDIGKWPLNLILTARTLEALSMKSHSFILVNLIFLTRHDKHIADLTLHGRMVIALFISDRIIVKIAQFVAIFTFE